MNRALAQALTAIGTRGWLVGGALRDRLLGRASTDYDIALGGDPEHIARALARDAGGHPFSLSMQPRAWRVVSHKRLWQVDLVELQGGTIEADLALRDFTINAIAQPLAGGDRVDPFGGLEDLRARRLRMVSAGAFDRDPLRTIRLARLACELGFALERETAAVAASSAPGLRRVAPERTFAELGRIVSCGAALRGLELMDELAVMQEVLPELARLHGVPPNARHEENQLDAYEHTHAVLAQTVGLELDPERVLGSAAQPVSRLLAQPLANELTRWQALRFGALFFNVAKGQARRVNPGGRPGLAAGHDEVGARMAYAALKRLRASERLCEHVAALTANHLCLGLLVHQAPLGRRAVYRYLRACSPVQVDVTLLSVAGALVTREHGSGSGSGAGSGSGHGYGHGSGRAAARHLELARQLLDEALAWRSDPPRAPVKGDELARVLAIAPGPELGRLLAALQEASFANEIKTREQAFQRARELLREGSLGSVS
ncbi:MAG: hypothetical protein M3Y17_08345 [Actinomycetota bacterium]|nr:hypothetical protein [Actinomycetota bacterium]